MTDYQNLSENELQAVIENAEKALKNKLANRRKEVITQIKELAASIDVTVEIVENEKDRHAKALKCRLNTDTLKTLIKSGRAAG